MSKKEVKTNAMRMLDRMKIPYEYEEYECDEFSDGIETADKLGYDHKYVYRKKRRALCLCYSYRGRN